MAKWARIENNTTMEITDIDPNGRFHPDLIWVGCQEEVGQRWTYNGFSFSAPIIEEL